VRIIFTAVLPGRDRACARASKTRAPHTIYISERVILVVLPSRVTEPESLWNVPAMPKHSDPVLILPLIPASVISWVAVLR